MLCQECTKREFCTCLCPEAERYANQDHVAQRESTQPQWKLDLLSFSLNLPKFFQQSLSTESQTLQFECLSVIQNKCLYLFYFEGLSYTQIAWKVHRRERAVEWLLEQAKKKLTGFFSDYRGE